MSEAWLNLCWEYINKKSFAVQAILFDLNLSSQLHFTEPELVFLLSVREGRGLWPAGGRA
jgi:hypothetical protein